MQLDPGSNRGTRSVVELIEPVGPLAYVDVRIGEITVRASVPADHPLSVGDVVGLTVEQRDDPVVLGNGEGDEGEGLGVSGHVLTLTE